MPKKPKFDADLSALTVLRVLDVAVIRADEAEKALRLMYSAFFGRETTADRAWACDAARRYFERYGSGE